MRPFALVSVLAAFSDAVTIDGGVARAPVAPSVTDASAPRPAPAGMVWVPGGTFLPGAPGARHVSMVTVGGYWMDRTEVTVSAYARCVGAHRCEPARTFGRTVADDLPVTDVSHAMARAYCQFAGGRLPTDHEWEFAARGADGRAYPWGGRVADCARANVIGCSHGPRAVGTLPDGASPFGVMDLAGNVAEWTVRDTGADPVETLPDGGRESGEQPVRGGSFASSAEGVRAYAHDAMPDGEARFDTGFRCVR